MFWDDRAAAAKQLCALSHPCECARLLHWDFGFGFRWHLRIERTDRLPTRPERYGWNWRYPITRHAALATCRDEELQTTRGELVNNEQLSTHWMACVTIVPQQLHGFRWQFQTEKVNMHAHPVDLLSFWKTVSSFFLYFGIISPVAQLRFRAVGPKLRLKLHQSKTGLRSVSRGQGLNAMWWQNRPFL